MLVVSIDPGESSAAAILEAPEGARPYLLHAFQVPGGVDGFLELLETLDDLGAGAVWICEKFSPRPSNATGFQQSLKTTLPLVCEGILIGRGLMPVYSPREKRYRDPALQYLVGGKDKADKRKRMHKFLRDNGYYRTGKDFGTADADDARSAIAHGINYLIREVKHKPAYQLVVDWLEKEEEK